MAQPAYSFKLADNQTYSIAHTAQCKLNMAARDPDRNLRFMLGHAFLLDKALFRVAEIEDTSNSSDEDTAAVDDGSMGQTAEQPSEGQSGSLAKGKVKFTGESTPRSDEGTPAVPGTAGEEARAGDEEGDEDAEDEGLGLTRFASASEMPPRMIPDEGDDDEDDEPVSPPMLPTGLDVAALVGGPESEEIGQLYESVRGCPCHGKKGEKSKGFWEVKDPAGGKGNKRLAIMQFDTEV